MTGTLDYYSDLTLFSSSFTTLMESRKDMGAAPAGQAAASHARRPDYMHAVLIRGHATSPLRAGRTNGGDKCGGGDGRIARHFCDCVMWYHTFLKIGAV